MSLTEAFGLTKWDQVQSGSDARWYWQMADGRWHLPTRTRNLKPLAFSIFDFWLT